MTDYVNSYEGGVGKAIQQGMREIKTAATTILGTCKSLSGGREIVYYGNGAAAQCAGELVQGFPNDTGGFSVMPAGATASVGATLVNLVNTVAITKDQFKDGFLVVHCGAGTGYSYMVEYHKSAAAADLSINIAIKDGLEVAMTTASICSLVANKYSKCVVTPDGGPTAPVLGVTLQSAAANTFGWLGKKGPFPCLIGSSGCTAGMVVVAGCSTGTVIGTTGESALDTQFYPVVGIAMQSAADSESGAKILIDFNL